MTNITSPSGVSVLILYDLKKVLGESKVIPAQTSWSSMPLNYAHEKMLLTEWDITVGDVVRKGKTT